jgi:thiol-disulfide isomerase/thioredoxin
MSKRGKQESLKQEKNISLKDVLNSNRACVLFYTTWCYFSKRFLPIFEEYSQRNPHKYLSVIVDDKPNICEEYAIEYYPTVILFKNGKIVKRLDAKPGISLSKKQLMEFTKEK